MAGESCDLCLGGIRIGMGDATAQNALPAPSCFEVGVPTRVC
jgi:hypothetical protein